MSAIRPLPTEDSPRVDYVALPPGAMIGRYEVVSVLGHGGFGITYLARDSQLDREVAIKEYLPAALAVRQEGSSVLPRSTEASEDFDWGRGRFIEEGRTLANLHEAPSIVKVFDFLERNGTAYIVMEVLRGRTLEDQVKTDRPLTPAALDAILWPLLAGLHKVHEAGFLHRDIKPANIVLGGDRATLIDFGASRAAMADRTKTMTAIFTPGYAAPEQFTAAKQGPWTDIYGLAATLYYTITGKAPPSAFDRLMEDTYEPLAGLQPAGFARSLLVGIDAGLSLHFEQRPQGIAGWQAMLRGEPADGEATLVMAPPPSTPTRPTPPTPPTPPSAPTVFAVSPHRHGRRGWIAVAAGVVLLAAAGAYYAFAPPPAPQVASPAPVPAMDNRAAAVQPAPEAARPAPAEAAEAALKLSTADRQRLQVALTALGFDTRGSDGAFGPRSREMIAAWQRTRKHPVTGYLTAAEQRALLREATPARPAEPEAETEAAVPSAPAIAVPPAPLAPPAAPPLVPRGINGFYVGSLSGSATGGGSPSLAPIEADLQLAGQQLGGRLLHAVCGSLPVSLSVDASGAVSGNLRLYEASGCSTNAASASGRVNGGSLTLDLRGVDVSFRGTLLSRPERTQARPAPSSGLRTDVP